MIRNKNADIIRAIKKSGCTCKDITLESLEVTENDTYTAEEGKAWNEVTVNVEGGGSEITMYQAWMKAFNSFETEYFPVTPKKIVKGWAGNVMVSGTPEEPISLEFLGETTDIYYYPDELAQVYNLEDVPEDIYENLDYDGTVCTFLYDLDELNQHDCRIGTFTPAQTICLDGYIHLYEYGSGINKYVSNVALIDGKYYIWFQNWD